tara:strand:+ start:401 stop:676 length:276 start_codon:yes stop_codon:yes gene_type:complete
MRKRQLISEWKKQSVMEMYLAGHTYKEIGMVLEVNQGSICNIIKDNRKHIVQRKPQVSFPKPSVDPDKKGAFGRGFWDDNLIIKKVALNHG